ncbi:MAG: tetratricopeptide repeat protein [Thermodesulfobacteriota bacterium]|nr:tetratricopeptide repeat protein [Thermodesulfobacteriota bacterium]
MAKKKRISRKQLLKEPDEFLTLSARALQFAAENRKQLSYVVVGLVVVLLVGAAIGYFLNLSQRRAYRVFDEGISHYVAQVSGEKSALVVGMATERFAEAIEKHGSTRAAELSLPLYGNLQYEAGSYDKAIALYRQALDAFPGEEAMEKLIWNGLGYAYEGNGEYQAAVEWFKKIADSESRFLKAEAYYHLGRVYEAMGKGQEAREAYQRLVEAFPNAVHFRMAKEKVQRLQGQG